ncbi:unnamed protein product, partial [Vitis vinifera]|uniref:Uncharacterized protein n=1 Tax=Vitis vinifera TaxID=29760 RepID=D7T508_VITVI
MKQLSKNHLSNYSNLLQMIIYIFKIKFKNIGHTTYNHIKNHEKYLISNLSKNTLRKTLFIKNILSRHKVKIPFMDYIYPIIINC